MGLDKDIKLTIVIVDDNQDEHFFIKRALKDFKNILFNDYYNGEDFLHFLEQKSKQKPSRQIHPDIVILEVNVPKMGGFEIFDLIEQKGLKGRIHFYILTSHITEKEQQNCKKYLLKCFQKPFNVDHFTGLLKEMISEATK